MISPVRRISRRAFLKGTAALAFSGLIDYGLHWSPSPVLAGMDARILSAAALLPALQPAPKRQLRAVWPSGFNQSPFGVFSILLLGQGYSKEEFPKVCQDAWMRITGVSPLDMWAPGSQWGGYAVFCDSGEALDLGMVEDGRDLVVSTTAPLETYLAETEIVTASGERFLASDVWPPGGRAGFAGSVIVIIQKPRSFLPAEAYQLGINTCDPTMAQAGWPANPTPFVAVRPIPDYWYMVPVRAIAQVYGSLADEYECPGSKFDVVPEGYWTPQPNIFYLNSDQRTRLASAGAVDDVLTALPEFWGLNRKSELVFVDDVHQRDSNGFRVRAKGSVRLVEGAGGYRKGAVRSDFDCIMRRRPNSTDASEWVQAPGEFCVACKRALQTAMRGSLDYNLPGGRRVTLVTQKLLYDQVASWAKPIAQPDARGTLDSPAGNAPQWYVEYETSKDAGLKVTNIELRDRKDFDPFWESTSVVRDLVFEDLWVQYQKPDGSKEKFQLSPKDAKSRLEVNRAGGRRGEYHIGIKYVMTWDPAEQNLPMIEAACSLVLRGMANDFDPGGVAFACKLYPQIAMRHYAPPKGAATRSAKLVAVIALHGTISFAANNRVRSGTSLPTDLSGMNMQMDTQQVVLCTDSNSSDFDNKYSFSPNLAPGASQLVSFVPPFGVRHGNWQTGRRLAGVDGPNPLFAIVPYALSVNGATARWGHLHVGLPVLPHWSWLFDYVQEVLEGGSAEFTGVYLPGQPTSDCRHDGGKPRAETIAWPPAWAQESLRTGDYKMYVRKEGRQGGFDSVHISGYMGVDSHGRRTIAAPFCADVCLHMHWRWGVAAVSAGVRPYNLYHFFGWGDGWNQGANTARGAPLIPPNQGLKVRVMRQGADKTLVKYDVEIKANGRALEYPQIIFEQGMGFAFNYNGLSIEDLILLRLGTVQWVPTTTTPPGESALIKAMPREERDAKVRMIFKGIYERSRWYDQAIDGVKGDVTQVPEGTQALGVTPEPGCAVTPTLETF